jgi:ATP-dependent phosphoenolpyruvate carboxykinase
MIAEALSGNLKHSRHQIHEQFGIDMITEVKGVSSQEILKPWNTWDNVAAYRQAANKLATSFQEKFMTAYSNHREAMKLMEIGPKPV